MADGQLYFIEEFDKEPKIDPISKKKVRGSRPRVVKQLDAVYKNHGRFYDSMGQFLEEVLDNPAATRGRGYILRKATAQDEENYGDVIEIVDQLENFQYANKVMEQTKQAARLSVTDWFGENIGKFDSAPARIAEVTDFMQLNEILNERVFITWIVATSEDEDRLPDRAIKALWEYTTSKIKDGKPNRGLTGEDAVKFGRGVLKKKIEEAKAKASKASTTTAAAAVEEDRAA